MIREINFAPLRRRYRSSMEEPAVGACKKPSTFVQLLHEAARHVAKCVCQPVQALAGVVPDPGPNWYIRCYLGVCRENFALWTNKLRDGFGFWMGG